MKTTANPPKRRTSKTDAQSYRDLEARLTKTEKRLSVVCNTFYGLISSLNGGVQNLEEYFTLGLEEAATQQPLYFQGGPSSQPQ
jgi:hypothetical protein